MTKKISFKELAEFIASDATLDLFPDIVYPLETRFPKAKVAWLEERLDTLYNRWLENPEELEVEELTAPTEDEDL